MNPNTGSDVNRDGAVNALDALLIQQALVGLQMPLGLTILPHGDANCDGRVKAADALIVLRAAVGSPRRGHASGRLAERPSPSCAAREKRTLAENRVRHV